MRQRGAPLIVNRTALLFIDVQNGVCTRKPGVEAFFYETMFVTVIPNLVRLRDAARATGMEVIYTTIESLTKDGRDRSLDYKLTGFHFPKGSAEARVIAELEPGPDEIVLPKTSSSPFNSTTIDYVLRNMGIDAVIVGGFQTDQCIDHTIRDGADRGYEMTCVTDACTTKTEERHYAAIAAFKGYCRQATTYELLQEMTPSVAGRDERDDR
jgi:nicotinamidase-related amidase